MIAFCAGDSGDQAEVWSLSAQPHGRGGGGVPQPRRGAALKLRQREDALARGID